MDLTDLERAEPPIPRVADNPKPTKSSIDRVEQLSRDAVDKAVAQEKAERRGYTITKFGRHDNGYWHARVTVDGQGYYLHRRFGSWMAPGQLNGLTIMKEVEGLVVGSSVDGRGKEIKEVLQQKAHAIEKAERLAARPQEDSNAAESDNTDADHAGDSAGGEAESDDLRERGD